ncbi:MAG: NAD(P)H-dependent oxidoreductase subunit E [Burkholderiales bacterium]
MAESTALELNRVVEAVAQRYRNDPSKLVQILREVQDALRHIPEPAVDLIAAQLRLPRAKVAGVRSFYTFFHDAPRGEYEILFSDNITDRYLGKQDLLAHLCKKLWLEPDKVSEDGLVTVGSTSCTGMSDQGPAALVNGYPLTQLSLQRVDAIAELIGARAPLSAWPQEFFAVDDNIRRRDLLTQESFVAGAALLATFARGTRETLAEIDASGLRGRGGAGFKTASKWSFCHAAVAEEEGSVICDIDGHPERFVVCNADEGEPGTFKDRVLLNSYADLVFEGMTVCARIVGAQKGFLYLRGEYRYLLGKLEGVLQTRRQAGLLGEDILGQQGFSFDIEIHLGAGAYICGEESALIESLEGKRGVPRNRPPFPVTHGYLGRPTVVNNVETFAAAAKIAAHGGAWFNAVGTPQSAGTKLLSICGDCARPGVYEYPFGVTVRQILADCGAQDTQAVQVGGPSGTCISEGEFDRAIAFEDLATGGSFMVFGRSRDMFEAAHNFTAFFAHESCGFCTPCRVGTALLEKGMEKIASGHGTPSDLAEYRRLAQLMRSMSHCGLGQTAANPFVHSLDKFRETYDKRLRTQEFEPSFDLDKALEAARKITGRDDNAAHLGAKYEP